MQKLEEIRGVTFGVLDHGFVRLVDVMGSDQAIEEAARVSYGEGTRQVSDTRTLLRYLMRHRHTSPFEQAELKFMVKVPMDCWRQWIRTRTAHVNEYSTRYSEAIDEAQQTPPDIWRTQSKTNKQGSGEFVTEWPKGYSSSLYGERHEVLGGEGPTTAFFNEAPTPGDYLSHREKEFQKRAREVYEERLRLGVSREQARKDLPLSTYTIAYWKIDLHNLLHFLSLRMDSHAQWEIREFANVIGEKIVKPLFPLTWEAFEDYRLKSVSLSRVDLEVCHKLIDTIVGSLPLDNWEGSPARGLIQREIPNKREAEECVRKLEKVGILQLEIDPPNHHMKEDKCDQKS